MGGFPLSNQRRGHDARWHSLNLSCLDPSGRIDVSSAHFNYPQGGFTSDELGEAMAMVMDFFVRCFRNMIADSGR
jgi:hypothetical protein